MEHNAEKIIRQKMKGIEEIPVNWDKERVWSSINKTNSTRLNGHVFYYAAATILLAVAVIIYSTQLTERERLVKQIRLVELAIEKQVSAAIPSAPQECLVDDVKLSMPKYFSERTADENIVPNELVEIHWALPLQRNDSSDSIIFLQNELTDPVLVEAETILPIANQNTIEPIIRDYLPEQKDNAVANRNKRKVKVRFFSTPEKKPLDAEASTPFILARIK